MVQLLTALKYNDRNAGDKTLEIQVDISMEAGCLYWFMRFLYVSWVRKVTHKMLMIRTSSNTQHVVFS